LILSSILDRNEPKLLKSEDEIELLAHLKAVDPRSETDASKAARSGYYRLLHRAMDSMTTLSEEYVADVCDRADHRRRAALHLCTELCFFWNNGLAYIFSTFPNGAQIPLISSEGMLSPPFHYCGNSSTVYPM
jgi:hypothetical protein